MKLIRLRLEAFGPFTDTELVFGEPGQVDGLHLVHGPNEAGKSSLLRAMADLRFGIPAKTPDAFLHPYDRLRISALFQDEQGRPVALSRRKGNRNTLQQVAQDLVCPKTPEAATPEQERALTGGLGRREFEQMFGLDHARLREGGQQLLEGRGELGAALFEASAGTRGIPGVLSRLETDAKAYFNPHGRSTQPVINQAWNEMETQRHLLRSAQTRPAQWQQLQRGHRSAAQALQALEERLEARRRRERELAELRTVAPLLQDLDGLRRQLDGLARVPDLAEDARDRRLAAQQALERADSDLQEARDRAAQCARRLAGLSVETHLLQHADAIERFASRLDTVAEAHTELRRQRARSRDLEQRLEQRAERIDPGAGAPDLLQARPSEADRVILDTALEALPGLVQRLQDRRQRLDQLQREQRDADTNATPADTAAREALVQALQRARALGDVDARLQEQDAAIDTLAQAQGRALGELGAGDCGALRGARPLLAAEVDAAERSVDGHDAEQERLQREARSLQGELEEQRLRRQQLTAGGEVVTAQTLRTARARRDALWAGIRRVWVERSAAPEEAFQGQETGGDPVRAFEQAVDQADHQADRLRVDATRAAAIEECGARIARMEARLGEIEAERRQLQAAREAHRERWGATLNARGLPPLEPAALRQWQQRRETVLEAQDRLERQRAQRDREAAAREAAVRELQAALGALGQTPATTDLGVLIEAAAAWEQQATAREARREERRRAARQRQRERESLQAEMDELQACRDGHARTLAAWHGRLRLPQDAAPAAVRARLEELDELGRLQADLEALREGQDRQQALVDAFADRARDLARLLQEPEPEDPEDLAARLRDRLRAAQEREQQRRTLEQEQVRARADEARAQETRQRQEAVLESLAAAAGVPLAQLPEMEARAAQKRAAREELRRMQTQLSRSSARPEADLRKSLEGLDLAAIESEQARCRADIEALEADVKTARQREEEARRALAEVDTSGEAARAREAMESAAAGMAAAVHPWIRLRLAHTLLQRALERFRERSQGPMVEAASRHFHLMTHGRYLRLETDDTREPPVLRAVRRDDRRVEVEALSEGTRDQLYLALRLAALELHGAGRGAMPLVLDDVLVTTDDHRAARVLRALAAFAEGGQVLLFTHHRHLLDVARGAVDGARLRIHELGHELGHA